MMALIYIYIQLEENNFIKAEAIYFEFPSIFEVTKDLL